MMVDVASRKATKTMNRVNEGHRFKIGAFNCTFISDGTFTYKPPTFPPPTTFLFANAQKEDLTKTVHKHNLDPEKWTEWTSPYLARALTVLRLNSYGRILFSPLRPFAEG
jgi:hypothetical protein